MGLYVDGGAAVRKMKKRHALKLGGTTKKPRRTILCENSAGVVKTVILTSDV